MSKITLTDLVNLQNETTAVNAINNNNAAIEAAMDNTLSRDGTSPNQMSANLDMNANRVLNLPAPLTISEPLRLEDLNTFNGGGTISSIPAGGTSGQALVKSTNADYDVNWSSESASLSAGTNIAITGTTPATISTITSPTFTGVNVSGLTASQSVQTDGSKNLASLANTGTGNNVLATSPTLVTPVLGTPTSGTLTSCTGLPVNTGISGLGTGVATFLATPSSANLAAAVTDETGSGALVFGTSPTLASPTLTAPSIGSAVATNLTFSPTTGGIVGTTTNNNANAGVVGEYVSSTVLLGSAVALTTAVAANITSISLTAGDWDVWVNARFTGGATTNVTRLLASISTTSATADTNPSKISNEVLHGTVPFATSDVDTSVGAARLSLASTTTIYFVAIANFTVSTCSGYGIIQARRIR